MEVSWTPWPPHTRMSWLPGSTVAVCEFLLLGRSEMDVWLCPNSSTEFVEPLPVKPPMVMTLAQVDDCSGVAPAVVVVPSVVALCSGLSLRQWQQSSFPLTLWPHTPFTDPARKSYLSGRSSNLMSAEENSTQVPCPWNWRLQPLSMQRVVNWALPSRIHHSLGSSIMSRLIASNDAMPRAPSNTPITQKLKQRVYT